MSCQRTSRPVASGSRSFDSALARPLPAARRAGIVININATLDPGTSWPFFLPSPPSLPLLLLFCRRREALKSSTLKKARVCICRDVVCFYFVLVAAARTSLAHCESSSSCAAPLGPPLAAFTWLRRICKLSARPPPPPSSFCGRRQRSSSGARARAR